ncbi:MAG: citrulline utilization hydrolase CtlX [Flavobacteriales bacterium]
MNKQSTSNILMIQPVCFRMNEQTAVNNYYQSALENLTSENVQEKALQEFNTFVEKLTDKGVKVIVVEDTSDPDTPDSIFPNNWISFHADARVGLYPMFAENRRAERREDIIDLLRNHYGFKVEEIVDFTEFEEHNKFLEGTGSMVLDRVNKICYAALSVRTDQGALDHFCEQFSYVKCAFSALQSVNEERKLIYHTNVMMCIADKYAVICLDSIDAIEERMRVIDVIEKTGKTIVEITEDQKEHFAGNMLQVFNEEGKSYLVMSSAAFNSLEKDQIEQLTSFNEIIHSAIDTIEICGGGSARCMMAEVFLPKI